MSWPGFIEELKERYLADEASVFVIDGVTDDLRWDVDGESLETAKVLVRFLRRTREVVGVLRPAPPPSRLEFADFTDRQKFENLVKAADLLAGGALAVSEQEATGALARIWRALSTTGTDQAWIVTDTERLVPGPRKRVDPIPAAPDLFQWATHPTLRRSNNVVVFLADDVANVRAELLQGAAVLSAHGRVPEPATADTAELLDTVEAPAREDDPSTPTGRATGDLRTELEAAVVRALCAHPEDHRPARIPVMEAIARVVADRRPDRWGALTFSLGEDGAPVVQGPGADAFLAAWRGDVALDASAGMLVRNLPGTFSEQAPPTLDATAMGALVRRVQRLL